MFGVLLALFVASVAVGSTGAAGPDGFRLRVANNGHLLGSGGYHDRGRGNLVVTKSPGSTTDLPGGSRPSGAMPPAGWRYPLTMLALEVSSLCPLSHASAALAGSMRREHANARDRSLALLAIG